MLYLQKRGHLIFERSYPLKKRTVPFSFLIILSSIWLFALCLMVFVFIRKLTPVYTQETLTSSYFIATLALQPGDIVTQSFTATQNTLHTVEFAFYFDENLSDAATAQVVILRGSEIVAEQPLGVRFCPNKSFLTVSTGVNNCAGDTFTLKIENISDGSAPSDNMSFSLMATDKTYLYLNNMDDYRFNDLSQKARMLCRFTYQTGYSYYQALTYAFWVFLAALIATKLFFKVSYRFRQ